MVPDILGLDRALPWLVGAFAAGYLAGSVPFGLLVARLFGLQDLRSVGSGNIGATNVLRTGHRAAAALTLALDLAKGLAAAWLGAQFGGLAAAAAGCGAVIGHCFPVWLGFRGGKGVATAFGVLLGWNPAAAGIALVGFAAVFAGFRIVSVASMTGAVVSLAGLAWLDEWEAFPAALVILLVIVGRHGANIARLWHGQEKPIRFRSDDGS